MTTYLTAAIFIFFLNFNFVSAFTVPNLQSPAPYDGLKNFFNRQKQKILDDLVTQAEEEQKAAENQKMIQDLESRKDGNNDAMINELQNQLRQPQIEKEQQSTYSPPDGLDKISAEVDQGLQDKQNKKVVGYCKDEDCKEIVLKKGTIAETVSLVDGQQVNLNTKGTVPNAGDKEVQQGATETPKYKAAVEKIKIVENPKTKKMEPQAASKPIKIDRDQTEKINWAS